jgi:hypothetical protein
MIEFALVLAFIVVATTVTAIATARRVKLIRAKARLGPRVARADTRR